MKKNPGLVSTLKTRERILNVAMRRFAKHSYDETGLRDIAADVGVDVAYVHRCFGSKRQLFAEVMSTAIQADALLDDIRGNLVGGLTERMVSLQSSGCGPGIHSLDILVHSLSSTEAVEVHRDFIVKDLIEPVAFQLKGLAEHRAALIVAFLAGLSILRTVIGISQVQATERKKIEALIREVLAIGPMPVRNKAKTAGAGRA